MVLYVKMNSGKTNMKKYLKGRERKMIKNKVRKICRTMRMSRYNFLVRDREDNLIIYNFLTGITSLVKIMKLDTDMFSNLFLKAPVIYGSDCEKYMDLTEKLLELGILIDADVNEGIMYNAKSYEEIYDNKLYLTILPTGKCNFNCSYCLESEQSFSREKMSVRAQNAILKFVQKNIHKYNEVHVSWFGGEPLLETSIIEHMSKKLIQICKLRCIPYSAQVTTNGYLLDNDTLEMLYKQRIYEFMITVDGFKEQHDRFRSMHNGEGTYDTIMQNLINIRDNKYYRFAHITIRVNITRDVLNSIDDFITYIDSLFSGDPRFTFLFIPAVNYSKIKPTDELFASAQEVLERLNSNSLYMDKLFNKNANTELITPTANCPASLKNSYVIASDLRAYKCDAHYDMEDNCIGFIDMDGNMMIDEVLHGKWYLTSEFLNRTYDGCVGCFYRPACPIGGRNCPYKYLANIQESITCPVKTDGFTEILKRKVLDVADRFTCYVVSF